MNAAAAPKANPETLTLRASPRPVTRLNRRMLAVIAGALATAVLGATLWSLQAPKRSRATSASELYNVDRVTRSESLTRLPADYSQLPVPPEREEVEDWPPILGEPLPGDLGGPIVRAQRSGGMDSYGYADPAETERLNAERDAEAAAKSSVFFRSGQQAVARADAAPAEAMPASQGFGNAVFEPAGPALVAAQPADPIAIQNRQDQKQGFMERAGDTTTRNPASVQLPTSPYQVMAGTIIPAALVTGINSDLPGQVIANVTEAVYDTATGQHLLIPQGSRLIGRYDSQIAFGQRRVLLVWTRLILPDTSSISLDRLPGVDPAGYAGQEDGIDWHWDRILAGAALSTLLGVGAELAAPERDGSDGRVIVATRESAQETINEIGQEITRRNLSVQPTLTVRPGFPMRVMVNKDLVLRPYQPLFFQRGSSP
ncbi:MAG: TrbI/VirB10 family protein [Panacagrimonas sp.]